MRESISILSACVIRAQCKPLQELTVGLGWLAKAFKMKDNTFIFKCAFDVSSADGSDDCCPLCPTTSAQAIVDKSKNIITIIRLLLIERIHLHYSYIL